MRNTVRVSASGKVTHGVRVLHRAANVRGDNRLVATPPMVVRTRRFAPGGIPAGVNQHLPCTVYACPTCGLLDDDHTAIL